MRIGILADTHDNLPMIAKAVNLLNQKKLDFVLHAGDYIAPFAAVRLNDLSCPYYGVFGNNDGEKRGLRKISAGKIKEPPLRITLGERKIVLVHEPKTVKPIKEQAEVIIFGHTHKPEVLERDNCLLINPGECAGWLSDRCSIAILDLDILSPEILYF